MSDTKEKMKRAELAAALGRLGELNPYNTAAKSAGDAATGLAMQYQQKLDEEEAKKKKSSGLASIVGGVVGLAVGGPAGAAVGAGLGETAESKIRGNELGDSLMAGGKAGLSALLLGNAAEGAGLTKEFVQAKLGKDTFAGGALTKTDALNGLREEDLLQPLAEGGTVKPQDQAEKYFARAKELSNILVGEGAGPETLKTPSGQTSVVGVGGPTVMQAPPGSVVTPTLPEAEVGRQIAEKLKPGSGELGAALGQWVGTKAAERAAEKSAPEPVFGMTPEQVLAQREATSRDEARKAAETLRREEMGQERELTQAQMNQQAQLASERMTAEERLTKMGFNNQTVQAVLAGEITAEQAAAKMKFESEQNELDRTAHLNAAKISAAGRGEDKDEVFIPGVPNDVFKMYVQARMDPTGAEVARGFENQYPSLKNMYGTDYDSQGNPVGAAGSTPQAAPAAPVSEARKISAGFDERKKADEKREGKDAATQERVRGKLNLASKIYHELNVNTPTARAIGSPKLEDVSAETLRSLGVSEGDIPGVLDEFHKLRLKYKNALGQEN